PIRYRNDGSSQPLKILADGSQPELVFATASGRALFHPRPHVDPEEMPDADFPFTLNTGRLQHQWHTLTKTGKIATLNKLNPGPFVELHPEDAAELGIRNRDPVRLRSRRGEAVLPALVSDRVLPGSCFAPFHWNDLYGENLAVNAVTSDRIDSISQQPELKVCAVALERIELMASGFPWFGEPALLEPASIRGLVALAFAPIAETVSRGLIRQFGGIVGVNAMQSPVFTPAESTYLCGFISGLEMTAGA